MPFNSFDHYPMSWKPDKSRLKRPVYRSLSQLLEYDITHGFLAPGTKLPPQRELADYLDVNFTTITRAYKECELKGLIYGVTGSGTYVAPNAARSITIAKEQASNQDIELGFVTSFDQTNDLVQEAIKNVAEKSYLEHLLNYNDPSGIPHHKMAALNWMEPLGIQAHPEQMAIVSGAQNAVTIALVALFEPGQRIAVDPYTYANFIEITKMLHIRLVPIMGDENGMSAHALNEHCLQMKLHGVFLMPSCSNPTTIMMTEQRKMEIAHVIRKHDLLLIEDDTHASFSTGAVHHARKPVYSYLPEHTIYIYSTAKSICTGLRVAYVVFHERFKDRLTRAIYNVNVKTSSLDVEIITQLILSGDAHTIVARKKELAHTANTIFNDVFPDAPRAGHPSSFFRWLPLLKEQVHTYSEEYFRSKGVRVYHSNRFLSGAQTGESFLRVALSSTNTLEELQAALGLLKRILDE